MESQRRGEVVAQVDGQTTGLAGVIVSDGLHVARTDDSGAFTLPMGGGGPLVWVCLPSRWRAVSPWYLPAEIESPRFVLAPDPKQSPMFAFAYFTDIHLPREPDERGGFAAFMEDLRALAPVPAFGISGGDIELQSGVGAAYRDALATLPWPVYHVLGNHDLLVGQPDPRACFRRLFGPTYYSFNYGSAHLVVLDGLVTAPEKEGWRNVEGELSQLELDWLVADLEATTAAVTLAFIHIPPVSSFPLRQDKQPGDEPAMEVRRAADLARICRGRVRQIHSGHFHENERIRVDDLEFVSTSSVCGQWWEKGGRPACNQDGSPKGYRIIQVTGEDAHSIYKPTGESSQRQLRIVAPSPGQQGVDWLPIGVNVFDGDPETVVEYAVNGGPWSPLKWTPQKRREGVFSTAHFWAGRAEVRHLLSGHHLLAVRARDGRGNAFTERVGWRKG